MDLPTPSTQKLQSIDGRIDGRSPRGGGLDARQLERLGRAAGRPGRRQPLTATSSSSGSKGFDMK